MRFQIWGKTPMWLRDRRDVERLGAGFGLSRTTAYRYRDEVLEVLSDQAPDLQEALGLVGDDVTVARLVPVIKAWPGESGHHRAGWASRSWPPSAPTTRSRA